MQEPQRVDSAIPPPLQRSPRRVRRKPGTLTPLLLGRILSAPVLAAVAALVALVVLEPLVVFLIPAQPARVVGRWFDQRRPSAYYIDYQFDRSGFTSRDQVLLAEYSAFQLGQTVKAHLIHLGPLGYSALDRSPRAYARYRMITWYTALFGLVIGWIMFYAIWLLPWRAYWLTRHGQATFGAVVEKGAIQTLRRNLHFTLTYQFKACGTLRAKRIRISWQRYDSADLKDLVIILFDPARPNRSIVYDYCDFVVF
jgi:hypothetical protein